MLNREVVQRLTEAHEGESGSTKWGITGYEFDSRTQAVAGVFADLVTSGALDLPLPGRGETRARWNVLAKIAEGDLCVARLAEAHLDALAILAELHGPAAPTGSRWGVWAAHPPRPTLRARLIGDEWFVSGTKPFCSGARICTNALVTADAGDGYRLFAIQIGEGVRPTAGTWPAIGMGASDSLTVEFHDAVAVAVGAPEEYLTRPGFWHGAVAVAACWYGGAVGLARALVQENAKRALGPHALAHLGAIDAGLTSLAASFAAVAEAIDRDPTDHAGGIEIRAMQLRAQTETVVSEVLDRVGRALGARPLCLDGAHAALAADLPVYVRQSHAESDLERLGTLVLEKGTSW